MSGLGLTFLRRGNLAHPIAGSDYILSENRGDPEVFRILMSKGVSSDGVGITKDDAAKVTTISTWFKGNSNIVEFEELRFFTGLTSLVGGYQNGAFYNCDNLERIALPPSLINLGGYSFQSCTKLVNVGGLEFVQVMGEGVFQDCPLTEHTVISMPSLTGSLLKRTFTGMKHSYIVDNLGTITKISGTQYNDNVFGSGLIAVTIPPSIELISYYAFNSNTKLQVIICEAATPPTINNSFTGPACPIYVPDTSVDAYKAASGWSGYASRIKPLSEYKG